ncbi:MAG: glycosyltransferase [Myxococcota bacterium]|nr:glycosyltransferase [Myxococcota bacterium]
MIPSTAHFIWFGTSFPWLHVAALRSASARGGFERVILHHTDELTSSPYWPELENASGIELHRLNPADLFARLGTRGQALYALFSRLNQPAARANMVRAALLYSEGGVYLDTDTITVKPLTSLRMNFGVFFGEEHVVLPAAVAQSLNPIIRLNALRQDAMRDVCRRLPRGWRTFRRLAPAYPVAANNAVLGSEPKHPFIGEMLDRMIAMPPKRQLVRYALGTHLLQEVARDLRHGEDVYVAPPAVFYPLGPEISQHWFRAGSAAHLEELLQPSTLVVHWYASVRTKTLVPQLVPRTVQARSSDWALCALAASYADQSTRQEHK